MTKRHHHLLYREGVVCAGVKRRNAREKYPFQISQNGPERGGREGKTYKIKKKRHWIWHALLCPDFLSQTPSEKQNGANVLV
jgi:hypothetical protein